MTAPTLHERRDDAEVVVYGDTAPITDEEWSCARILHSRYKVPLIIDATDVTTFVVAGNVRAMRVTEPTRADAVAALLRALTDESKEALDDAEKLGALARERVRQATEDAERHEANAARLRALLGGSAS